MAVRVIADPFLNRKRIEGQITELGTKQEKKKVEILQLQSQLQQQAGGGPEE
jgi:hypothetical protein